MTKTKSIGRDAITGRFLTIDEAQLRKSEALVQTIRLPTAPAMRQRGSGTCLPAAPAMRQRVSITCLPTPSLETQGLRRSCLPTIPVTRRKVTMRGRDAVTGRFITVDEASRRKNTTVVETIGLPVRRSII